MDDRELLRQRFPKSTGVLEGDDGVDHGERPVEGVGRSYPVRGCQRPGERRRTATASSNTPSPFTSRRTENRLMPWRSRNRPFFGRRRL